MWIQCLQSIIGSISATIPTKLANASLPRLQRWKFDVRECLPAKESAFNFLAMCSENNNESTFPSQIQNQLFLCIERSRLDLTDSLVSVGPRGARNACHRAPGTLSCHMAWHAQ